MDTNELKTRFNTEPVEKALHSTAMTYGTQKQASPCFDSERSKVPSKRTKSADKKKSATTRLIVKTKIGANGIRQVDMQDKDTAKAFAEAAKGFSKVITY